MLSLNVKVIDAVLEEDMDLPIQRTGFFVQYDGKYVDALMVREGGQMIKPDNTSVELKDSPNDSDPKLVIIVKDIQNDDPYIGSVSIARSIITEGDLGKSYKMWITLFDDQGDDEYDGAMGLHDDEEPRICVEFTVRKAVTPPVVQRQSSPATKKERPKSPAKSYMNPIHNLKDKKGEPTSP